MSGASVITKFRFEIEPQGKLRPKFTRSGHAYTPGKTRQYEAHLAMLMKREAMKSPLLPFDGPVHLRAHFFLRKPSGGKLHKTKTDLDNYLKALCDAANGILWDDDRQIVSIWAVKDYASKGYAPSISVDVIQGEWGIYD